MNHRICRVHQSIVIRALQPKLRRRQVAPKNPYLCLKKFVKRRKRQMQLQSLPQTQLRLARIARAHQHIQHCIVLAQQICRNMRADVAGRSGQEYRHVAPFVPVFIAPFFSAAGICSTRGSRASSGLPSISGYVHRRNAGM